MTLADAVSVTVPCCTRVSPLAGSLGIFGYKNAEGQQLEADAIAQGDFMLGMWLLVDITPSRELQTSRTQFANDVRGYSLPVPLNRLKSDSNREIPRTSANRHEVPRPERQKISFGGDSAVEAPRT